MKKEKAYIAYRRLKAFGNSIVFYLLRVNPIKKNRISVCTFEGRSGFCCNPKYIVEELHRRNQSYEFIWFVNDMSKEFPDYIRKVKNTLWNRAYYLGTSKVWLDNYRKPYGTVKRKGQYYLNTNHYTIGIKCTGLWRGKGFSQMAYLVSKNDSDMIDDVIIDSDWCEEVTPKGLLYNGTYLKTGAPRCDALYGDRSEYRSMFRQKHNLPVEAKVIMYAPTFREGAKNGKRSVHENPLTLDFEKLLEVLKEKFGGEWFICLRVHPQLAAAHGNYSDDKLKGRIIDVSKEEDMYEILAGMDMYITDYSSAIFEAGFAHIPAFVYADDIDTYAKDRGNLMWNFVTDPIDNIGNNKEITPQFDVRFPFAISKNNDALKREIERFDMTKYEGILDSFYSKLGLIYDGMASKKIADVICKVVKREK